MRLTKHRQEILSELENNPNALSAAEIHAELPNINLVTIYRNLEYFVKEGLIKKLLLNAEEARYELQNEPHHHAICIECGDVIHFMVNESELIKEFSLPGFKITNLEITLRGKCGKNHADRDLK